MLMISYTTGSAILSVVRQLVVPDNQKKADNGDWNRIWKFWKPGTYRSTGGDRTYHWHLTDQLR